LKFLPSTIVFVNQAKEIETLEEDKRPITFYEDYNRYCYSAIIFSISFLESVINELYRDISDQSMWNIIQDKNQDISDNLHNDIIDSKKINQKKEYYNKNFGNYPKTLKNYNILLDLANKPIFFRDSTYSEDIIYLFRIRNKLIHADFKWNRYNSQELCYSDTDSEFFTQIFENKFKPNPFITGGPYFPNRCIGYGCAKWALQTAVKFTDEFFLRMQMKPVYEHLNRKIMEI
jgi:hypothetical protein